jgi:phytoene dehydrogenase-like protein
MLNAFYRPKSRDNKFKNLFYTGGSVHPGGGMPLAIQSAVLLNQIL